MANKDIKTDAINNFIDTLEKDGVAVSNVKDGHILMFKTAHLKKLVEQHADQEKLIIFVKTAVLN